MILSLIVGISKNRAIGKDNRLLWNLSDDLKNFKAITLGKPIIMGRKTFDSIGRPLPGRKNIVITRDKNLLLDGVTIVNSFDDAIKECQGAQEAVLIGGSSVYNEGLSLVNKMYITYVECTILDADVYFPEFDLSGWQEETVIEHPQDDRNDYPWRFVEYLKIH